MDVAVRARRVVVADELVTSAGLLDQVPRVALTPFIDRLLTPVRAADPDGSLCPRCATSSIATVPWTRPREPDSCTSTLCGTGWLGSAI